jgi:hypothetical protein
MPIGQGRGCRKNFPKKNNMPFIKQLSITAQQAQTFPYNIPAVQFAKNIAINSGVTIFKGR